MVNRLESTRRISFLCGLVIVAFLVLVLSDRGTYSLYSTQVFSGENSLRGGSIEFSLVPKDGDPASAKAKNDGGNALRYDVRLVSAGDEKFCDELHLSVTHDGSVVYSGLFGSFEGVSGGSLEIGEDEDWSFVISIPDAVIPVEKELSCKASFGFEAWQAPYDVPTGWTDEETFVCPDTVLAPVEAAPPDMLESPRTLLLTGEAPPSADMTTVEMDVEDVVPAGETVVSSEIDHVVPEIVLGPTEGVAASTNDSVADPEGSSPSDRESPETELP